MPLEFGLLPARKSLLRPFATPSRPKEPQLRYTCGWAGPELAEGRKRMSDREWIEIGAAEADGEYYELFEAGFGVDISPK